MQCYVKLPPARSVPHPWHCGQALWLRIPHQSKILMMAEKKLSPEYLVWVYSAFRDTYLLPMLSAMPKAGSIMLLLLFIAGHSTPMVHRLASDQATAHLLRLRNASGEL